MTKTEKVKQFEKLSEIYNTFTGKIKACKWYEWTETENEERFLFEIEGKIKLKLTKPNEDGTNEPVLEYWYERNMFHTPVSSLEELEELI